MELWRLRYFTVVAEEEHVGRAAARLHVSQSPLSRQIRHLEEELGLELFVREGRGVRLTTAGREALALARGLLDQAERTRARLEALAGGDAGPLRIGYVQGAAYNGVLPQTLARLAELAPRVEPKLEALRSDDQVKRVEAGMLDVGFVHRLAAEAERCAVRRVCEEPFVLALPRDAGEAMSDLGPATLAALRWITLPRATAPSFHTAFEAAAARLGFVPDIAIETLDIPAALSFVASGQGAALVQASIACSVPPGVVTRAVPALDMRIETLAIWHRHAPSPATRRLIQALPAAV